MSQRCHCWIMQSSLWLCLSSSTPDWKAAPVLSSFVDPFQIPLFTREDTNKNFFCAELKMKNSVVTVAPASITACSLIPSALLRWHLLPPTSCLTDMLTASWFSKGKPTVYYLLVTQNRSSSSWNLKRSLVSLNIELTCDFCSGAEWFNLI